MDTQSLFFLTRVLKTARIRLLVWHVNSRCWSRNGVINARCSVKRFSLGKPRCLCTASHFPPFCRQQQQQQHHLQRKPLLCLSLTSPDANGGGASSLLGARPRRTCGVPSTSVWIELRRLHARSFERDGWRPTCVYAWTPTNTELGCAYLFFFFWELQMNYLPLVLD